MTHLVAAPHLTRCAAAWRSRHPGAWITRALGQYAMWTRATFVHPYEAKITGPAGAPYRRYAERYAVWLFFDLRPWLEPPTRGWFLHAAAMVRGAPVPYTLFGFVALPVLVVTVLMRLARPWTPAHATAVVALVCLLWPMLGACLSDGQEGNRMRVSSEAVLVVLAMWAAAPCLAGRPDASGPRCPVRGRRIG